MHTSLKKAADCKQVPPSVSPSTDLDLKLQPVCFTTVSCVHSHVRSSEKGLSDMRGQSASSNASS